MLGDSMTMSILIATGVCVAHSDGCGFVASRINTSDFDWVSCRASMMVIANRDSDWVISRMLIVLIGWSRA